MGAQVSLSMVETIQQVQSQRHTGYLPIPSGGPILINPEDVVFKCHFCGEGMTKYHRVVINGVPKQMCFPCWEAST